MTSGPGPVILGVTGSIAAYKACDIVGLLVRAGIDVHVILTREAERFIAPLTFRTLSRNSVVTDMFEAPDQWSPAHVSLAERAGLFLVAPATANVIGKLAGGIADDMLTCAVCATQAPVLIAPAMNDRMYEHPAVKENIARLTGFGYHFIGPVRGRLACGREGNGCLADPAAIVEAARKLLA